MKLARAVYDKVPYMSKVFEDKFNQKLIALIADNGYNLGTTFEWNNVADLKGQKLAGAGLNLKWLEFAGAMPVQSSLPEAYTSHADRRLQRLDHVPVRLGQLQALRSRQVLHRDRLRRDHLARPDDQQGALGPSCRRRCRTSSWKSRKEYEAKTGTVNEENYPKQIAELKAMGVDRPQAARQACTQDWAKSLDGLAAAEGRRNSTSRACRASQVSRSRSRRPKTTATSGRCATASNRRSVEQAGRAAACGSRPLSDPRRLLAGSSIRTGAHADQDQRCVAVRLLLLAAALRSSSCSAFWSWPT